jgi:long-chain fatty acid transport protein
LKRSLTLISVIVILIAVASQAFAGGYQVNEHSARATAMAGAVFSSLKDASAIYFNPGALSLLHGTHFTLGTTLIFPSTKFTGPTGHPLNTESELEKQMFYPSVFYGSHTLENGVAIGLGVFNPYGLGTRWPEDWVGKYLGIESTLRTYFFNPTVSYRIGDIGGIGVGLNYVYSTVTLSQALLLGQGVPDGNAELTGEGSGFGWNFGVYFKPTEDINIGIAYRSKITIDIEGEAELEVIQPLQPLLPGGDATTEFITPANLFLGVSYEGVENLSLNFGFQYVFWDAVEKILIDYKDKTLLQTESELPFNYENGYITRFGLEYNLNDKVDLRAGYLYDKNPSQDEYLTPRLPDSDRHGITLGFGYKLSDLVTVDFGYMYLKFVEREVTTSEIDFLPGFPAPTPMNGTYDSTANLLALNFLFNL